MEQWRRAAPRAQRWSILPLAAALAACAHGGSPPEPLASASVRAAQGAASARELAIAGFHALIVDGSPRRAEGLFEQALQTHDAEPYALSGRVLLATRSARPERALESALALLERAPAHPLALAAAHTLLDVSGTALSVDARLRASVPALLAAGPAGDVAHVLRSALAVATLKHDAVAHRRVLEDMGVPTVWTVLGPLSPWRRLATGLPTGPERTGRLVDVGEAPEASIAPRVVEVRDGRFSLGPEPFVDDVYALAVDLEVSRGGSYVVRVISAMDHLVLVDGAQVAARVSWPRPAPTVTRGRIALGRGLHRLLIRVERGAGSGNLMVSVAPEDGRPSELRFAPALTPPRRWRWEPERRPPVEQVGPAAALHAALRPESGDVLARFLAAGATVGSDPEGARRLVAGLTGHRVQPAVAALRAELALANGFVQRSVAVSMAARELDAVLSGDPTDVRARMLGAQQALAEGRSDDALEHLRIARAASAEPSGPLLLLQANAELHAGLEVGAEHWARAADAALPGLCGALELLADLALRREAVAEGDAAVAALAGCPGSTRRRAQHLTLRGRLGEASEAWARLVDRDDGDVGAAVSLARHEVARARFDDAERTLRGLVARWPRNAQARAALVEVLEHAGRRDEALTARRGLLAVQPENLSLRRVLEWRQGRDLLDEHAIPTSEALARVAGVPGAEDAASALLLDSAVVRVEADGSRVERIHLVQRALTQAGVDAIAEVDVPAGATLLALRTLKADGRTLEAEHVEGKDSVSLPGVEVGDAVELEYLAAHPPRGRAQPGFTAPAFFFQVVGQPNLWSRYLVDAPKSLGLRVDAHGVEVASPEERGDRLVFRHEARAVPPAIPEPASPPSASEWLPFVVAGAGQEGNAGLVALYADLFLERATVTSEVDAFARAVAAGRQGVEAVRAVFAAVSERIVGGDSGLEGSAATTLAQGRGSRTWLLYASLLALGLDARVVAVRTATVDPAPYRFPTEALLPYVCVRVSLPGGQILWLDPSARRAPFGELPEWALGVREAYLFPLPGKPLAELVRTPPRGDRPPRSVELDLALDDAGTLSGTGRETYRGFEAAHLAEALASITPDERNQALQQAMAQAFGGADITEVTVRGTGGEPDTAATTRAVGRPPQLEVSYRFTARRFARTDDEGGIRLPPLTYPARLGRRYLTQSQRRSPVYVETTERTELSARLRLPEGLRLEAPLNRHVLEGAFGRLRRDERQEGTLLAIDEGFELAANRIPPSDFEAFERFVAEVDLLQGRELRLSRPAARTDGNRPSGSRPLGSRLAQAQTSR